MVAFVEAAAAQPPVAQEDGRGPQGLGRVTASAVRTSFHGQPPLLSGTANTLGADSVLKYLRVELWDQISDWRRAAQRDDLDPADCGRSSSQRGGGRRADDDRLSWRGEIR